MRSQDDAVHRRHYAASGPTGRGRSVRRRSDQYGVDAMGSDKRERQKANRSARLAAEQAAEAKQRRMRFIRNAVLVTAGIIALGFLLSLMGCTSSGSSTTAPAKDAGGYGATPCPKASGAPRTIDIAAPFEKCIDPAKTYTATVTTTEGTVTLALDTKRTPITTNNFVALARSGYYDKTDFFRTEAGTGIIQGGSPHTQDNTDPGPNADDSYGIPDEALPFTAADYGPGTLAMARTSAPDSASGQFFLLATKGGEYLGDKTQLGADAGTYVAFGKVTKGLDVLVAISKLDDGSSVPSKKVGITEVTIDER